jgi:hypothetical protein
MSPLNASGFLMYDSSLPYTLHQLNHNNYDTLIGSGNYVHHSALHFKEVYSVHLQ